MTSLTASLRSSALTGLSLSAACARATSHANSSARWPCNASKREIQKKIAEKRLRERREREREDQKKTDKEEVARCGRWREEDEMR
eukprot:1513352-Rhodomonas_salina.1